MKFQDDISNMNTHTHTHTHEQAETNMSPLFQSWGHNDQNPQYKFSAENYHIVLAENYRFHSRKNFSIMHIHVKVMTTYPKEEGKAIAVAVRQ